MKRLFTCCMAMLLITLLSTCLKTNDDPHNKPFGDTYTQTTPWPKWIFMPWIWEGESTDQSARQIVDDYLAHDIPVGAIIIDSPWETAYNTFEWDTSLFPNPQATIDYMHSKNVRVFCWITHGIDTNCHPLYDYAKDHDYFMKTSATAGPAIIKWWKPTRCSVIDLYNPEAVAWFKKLMDKTLAYGIDGWKCDGSDFLIVQAGAAYSPYLQGNVPSRNDYSAQYYRLFHEYTREKLGNDRVITSRPVDNYGYTFLTGDVAAFTPIDISFACWVGDQDASFGGMVAALNNMAQSADLNYLSFGSDIGGYRTEAGYPNGRSKELFVRWAQLGALCPIMENGGGGEHRPWMFDEETNNIYSRFAKLHVKLVPYMMKTAEARYAQQKSMVKYLNKTDYQYLLGDDIFVAPVLSEANQVTVKFPAGSNWVYLFDKTKMYVGGTTEAVVVPIGEFPVYIKEGTDLVTSLEP